MKLSIPRLRRTGFGLAIVCGSLLARPAFAGVPHTNWPRYQGDALGYYASHLPNPMAIYVYSRDGHLVSVIAYERDDMKQVTNILTVNRFPKLTLTQLRDTSESLGNYLLDQGYHLRHLVNEKTEYTLVFTMWRIKLTDCGSYVSDETNYEQAVQNGVSANSNSSMYSVVVLEVGSPKLILSCEKSPHRPGSSTDRTRAIESSQQTLGMKTG